MKVIQTITAQSVLHKIVVNVGVGRMATSNAHFDEKVLPEIISEFKAVTGQQPALRHASKSIAGFKLRQGTVVGMNATLRGKRMRDFLERLNAIVFPRVRDFRGIPTQCIDANGNLTIGIREHVAFPEIVPENSKVDFGMEVTLVLKVQDKDKERAVALYHTLGIPLQKPKAVKVKAK